MLAWEAGSSDAVHQKISADVVFGAAQLFGLRMDQGSFQNLDGVLAPVQGSDRVHIQIHA